MITLKSILPAGLAYNHIVGTGGIGSGIFFSMKENDTLGRNESRMATLLPYKDLLQATYHYALYCYFTWSEDRTGNFSLTLLAR